MANVVFNVAKGRFAHYGTLPGVNDAIIAVPIEAAGLESDATIVDHDTLDAVLAGTSNEQTAMGRATATGVTVVVDDATNEVYLDFDDLVWTAATGNPLGALIICYDPDTTAGTDTDVIPLSKHDFAVEPSGGDVTGQPGATGFLGAT